MTLEMETKKNPLKVLRESLGLSQAKMAIYINIPLSTYQALEYNNIKEISNCVAGAIRESGLLDEEGVKKLRKDYIEQNKNWKEKKADSLKISPLRLIRKKLGNRVDKFCDLLGISPSHLVRLELGLNAKIGKKIINKLLELKLIDSALQFETDYKNYLKIKKQLYK